MWPLPEWDAPLAQHVARAKQVHRYLICLWVPCALTLVVMSSYISWIGVKAANYTDVSANWQSCLFLPKDLYYEPSALVPEIPLDVLGVYIEQICYLAMLCILMTFTGQIAVFRNWDHIGWLFPAGLFGLWCSLMATTYYTAAPIYPVPSQTTSTLLLIMIWLRKGPWEDANGGDNQCVTAYNYSACMVVLMVCQIYYILWV